MEKAFKLNKTSKYVIELEKYIEGVKNNNKLLREIFKKLEIEAIIYYLRGDGFVNRAFDEDEKKNIELSILPTDNDKLKFFKELCKPDSKDMCKFRNSSKIMKEIQNYCIENKMIINPNEPDLRDYIKSMNWKRYSRELFQVNDIWYLRIVNEGMKDDDIPEGFEQIKLSEYYSLKEKRKK